MNGQELLLGLLGIGLLVGILCGLPVAFILLGAPLLVGFAGTLLGIFDSAFLAAFPMRVFGLLTNPVLVSVPLFVLMGGILERSDIAKRMMLTAAALFGDRRGGIAYAVVIVGALLAASTGVIAATIFMLGMIALPAMNSGRYSSRLSAGLICASGSLGQIIPPSILLILLADQISSAYQAGRRAAGDWAADPVTVGDLFAGALLPGLLLVAAYLAYIFVLSVVRPKTCPPIKLSQIEGIGDRLTVEHVVEALIAPLLLIVLVLGSILAGIATPTESAAFGAGGALIMVAMKRPEISRHERRIYYGALIGATALVLLKIFGSGVGRGENLELGIATVAFLALLGGLVVAVVRELYCGDLMPVAKSTASMVVTIVLIVLGAFMLSLVFRGLGGEELVTEILRSLPGGEDAALFWVMLVIFALGFILEYVEIIFIVVPIAGPPLMAAGIDPIWFAVLVSLNLQMSFLTPPFGYALFYLRSVAPPSLTTKDIYISIVPFVALQLVVLGLVAALPPIATWLPSWIFD